MRVALMLRRTLIGVLALLLVSACTLKLAHALPRGGSATTAHDDTAAQFHATTRSIPELPADVWSLIAERTDVRTFHRLGATSRMHHAIARDEHGSEARMLLRHYGANNVLCVLLMVPPVPYAADSVRRWSAFHAVLAEMVSASARSAMATSAMAPHARQEHIADANNSTDAHARTTSLADALNAGFSCAAHMSNLPALISVELCMRDHELEPDYGRAVVAAVEGRGDDVIAAAGDLRVLTHLLKVVRMQRERHRDADASSSNGHASAASVGIAASFSDSHGSAARAHTRTNDRHIRLGQALGNALVISIQHQIAWLPAVVPPLLIEYGAHVDHAHGEPLVFASIRGLLDIVELLFDAGYAISGCYCCAVRLCTMTMYMHIP